MSHSGSGLLQNNEIQLCDRKPLEEIIELVEIRRDG
jgi:hypothetical protein